MMQVRQRAIWLRLTLLRSAMHPPHHAVMIDRRIQVHIDCGLPK
jgi:hypothetical protein